MCCEFCSIHSIAPVTHDRYFSTFTPLVFSVILWACNGRYEISYVDCLFLCVSAMTVCGLATVDLSSLTRLQQVILFFQMCLGSPVRVLIASSPLCLNEKIYRSLFHGSWYTCEGTSDVILAKSMRLIDVQALSCQDICRTTAGTRTRRGGVPKPPEGFRVVAT